MALSKKIKKVLKKNELIANSFYKIDAWHRIILYNFSPILLYKILFRRSMGRWPDLKNPQSFDEKLAWLNFFWRHPLKTQCADKYAMRLYVEKNGLGNILPKLLGVYENIREIDFNAFPEKFVLKCTHGCKMNIICRNKSLLNLEETRRKLEKWLKTDISKITGEIHYSKIKPRVICEEYLNDFSGDVPIDYKIYCFNGRAQCTLVCFERKEDGHAKFDFYDRDWKNKLPYSKPNLIAERNIPKPKAYEEMVIAAEILSKPFPFVRIDFYNIYNKAVLGEMTFTPSGCIDPGYTDLAQRELGKLIKLPEKIL